MEVILIVEMERRSDEGRLRAAASQDQGKCVHVVVRVVLFCNSTLGLLLFSVGVDLV